VLKMLFVHDVDLSVDVPGRDQMNGASQDEELGKKPAHRQPWVNDQHVRVQSVKSQCQDADDRKTCHVTTI